MRVRLFPVGRGEWAGRSEPVLSGVLVMQNELSVEVAMRFRPDRQ
jgi:hypothetical protein